LLRSTMRSERQRIPPLSRQGSKTRRRVKRNSARRRGLSFPWGCSKVRTRRTLCRIEMSRAKGAYGETGHGGGRRETVDAGPGGREMGSRRDPGAYLRDPLPFGCLVLPADGSLVTAPRRRQL
jgi:hypothetical protein